MDYQDIISAEPRLPGDPPVCGLDVGELKIAAVSRGSRPSIMPWIGSVASHAALLGWMSTAIAILPVQVRFHKGRAAVQLQATIESRRSEQEPTPQVELVEKRETEETPKPQVAATDTAIERRETTLPPPAAIAERKLPRPIENAELSKAEPNEPPSDPPVLKKPPPRKKPPPEVVVLESQVDSSALAASQAESGVDYDEPPQPHPMNRQPPYPSEAYVRRQQGSVVLRLEVTSNGTVGQVYVVQSSGVTSLDEAALQAARGWRYTPARRGGMSIAMFFQTRVNFSIRS